MRILKFTLLVILLAAVLWFFVPVFRAKYKPVELRYALGDSVTELATVLKYKRRETSLMVGSDFQAHVRLPASKWKELKTTSEFRLNVIPEFTDQTPTERFIDAPNELTIGRGAPLMTEFPDSHYDSYYIVTRAFLPETATQKKVLIRSFVMEGKEEGGDVELYIQSTPMWGDIRANTTKVFTPRDPFAE